MKNRRAPQLAALLALCACMPAGAQSSVTLSGQLGLGVNVLDHQGPGNGRVTSVADNLMSASWLRIGGVEDLGGGMRAFFRLETGINLDSGTASRAAKFWNRQSSVGLQWGAQSISLGRQFHASTERAIRTFDVHNLAGPTIAAMPVGLFGVNRFGNAATGNGLDSRTDNSLRYRLLVPGVIEFGASVAAGEGGTAGRSYAFDLARAGSGYDVGAVYVHYDNGQANPDGHVATEDLWALGGNVTLGDFRPYLAWYHSRIEPSNNANAAVGPATGGRTQTNDIASVGLAWQAGTQLRFTGAWYHDRGRALNGVASRSGTKETLVLAGYYGFSKRTELYAAVYANRFRDGYIAEALNLLALNRTPGTSSANGVSAGIRHNF